MDHVSSLGEAFVTKKSADNDDLWGAQDQFDSGGNSTEDDGYSNDGNGADGDDSGPVTTDGNGADGDSNSPDRDGGSADGDDSGPVTTDDGNGADGDSNSPDRDGGSAGGANDGTKKRVKKPVGQNTIHTDRLFILLYSNRACLTAQVVGGGLILRWTKKTSRNAR
jgi:hypothetical protein